MRQCLVFQLFSPVTSFLRRCWGLTGWPPIGEGLFYGWRRGVKVAEQIKPFAAGRLTQGPGWEPPPPGSHEKSWGKSTACVCEERKLIFCTPLTNISKVHYSCDVINDNQSNDWQQLQSPQILLIWLFFQWFHKSAKELLTKCAPLKVWVTKLMHLILVEAAV